MKNSKKKKKNERLVNFIQFKKEAVCFKNGLTMQVNGRFLLKPRANRST